VQIRPASPDDAGEILTVQRAAFVTEAQIEGTPHLPPLAEDLATVRAVIGDPSVQVLVAETSSERGRRVVGSIRVRVDPETGTAHVGRIVVAPDLHGQGIGSALLRAAESAAQTSRFELFTGLKSARNIGWYQRMGYAPVREDRDELGIGVVVLAKAAPG
jgi:ribosomal protein S18 acetylase RimI-like enzyme